MAVRTRNKGVWVRCKNGALYKNPRRIVHGGFVSFPEMDDEARASAGCDGIAYVWCDVAPERARIVFDIIDDALGVGAWQFVDSLGRHEAIEVPGSTPKSNEPRLPARTLPAYVWSFRLLKSIPEPHYHDGEVRYCGRVAREYVIDPEGGR